MKKLSFVTVSLLLSLNVYASSSVEFGSGLDTKVEEVSSTSLSDKKIPKYTIQLTTTKTIETAKKNLEHLPKEYRADTKLYKVGSYITARYKNQDGYSGLKKYLDIFHNAGFKDAYIVQTTKWHMDKNLIRNPLQMSTNKSHKNEEVAKQASSVQVEKELLPEKKLSKYVQSGMVLKADKAYKSGDETTAMIYYEMLYNSGYATQRVKNNLIYLYGKKGIWFEAKEIVEKERYASKYLYAYAYGALESNQDNFIENLSPYILVDKSGKLALLAGYYYEQKEDLSRALVYYKMAYEKNPSSLYNIYAYARALDIQEIAGLEKNKGSQQALKYYKKALQKLKVSDKNYNVVRTRITQLEEI